ncbi:hypothetical protein [Actinoplanes sp. NPDC049316]|uniref:hypothetical protein n=1 Tax=Actinoplanes sp. NPDC049316 TaxID=3154727 RepID=UPI00342A179B
MRALAQVPSAVQLPVQATVAPLPVPVPWKPKVVLRPAASRPFQAWFVTVTAPAVPSATPFQSEVIDAPPGSPRETRQPLSPAEPPGDGHGGDEASAPLILHRVRRGTGGASLARRGVAAERQVLLLDLPLAVAQPAVRADEGGAGRGVTLEPPLQPEHRHPTELTAVDLVVRAAVPHVQVAREGGQPGRELAPVVDGVRVRDVARTADEGRDRLGQPPQLVVVGIVEQSAAEDRRRGDPRIVRDGVRLQTATGPARHGDLGDVEPAGAAPRATPPAVIDRVAAMTAPILRRFIAAG